MEKRVAARAVIFDGDSIILMFRKKKKADGSCIEYYSLPGGGQELGETLEQNVIREVFEEFNLKVSILGYVGIYEDEKNIQYFYHCQKISGELALNGEEKERSCDENYYEPVYVKIKDIPNIDIMYIDIIDKALNEEYLKV
jgi:ADP-ribose pyrophosphatase YjhB (NUDIX family)